MPTNLIPMRWPQAWSTAALLRGSPINCILGTAGLTAPGLTVIENPPDAVKLLDGVWAKVRSPQRGSGGAGPTGKPWIESNGWRLLLARAVDPGMELWVNAAPERGEVLLPEAYLLMLGDVAAYGGHWVVSLDEALAKALAAGENSAAKGWERICTALRFFDGRRGWADFRTVAATGVISDFAGDNEFLSRELLNLAARRPLPLAILPKSRAASMDWTGLRAVVLVETAKPLVAVSLLNKLAGFVESGGTLIAPARLFDGKTAEPRYEYNIWAVGKGSLCVPRQQWSDPYQLAADTHLLVGREHDVVRTYNATSANVHYTESADGKHGLVQVLYYSTRAPAGDVSIALRKQWKGAVMSAPAQPEARSLAVNKSRFGVEIALPPFPVYAAIELES